MKKISIVFCMLIVFSSCSLSSDNKIMQSKSFYDCFDTAITISSYITSDENKEFSNLCSEIEKEYRKLNNLFDIYHEYEGITNLRTINERASNEPIKISKDMMNFLLFGKEMAKLTNGKTNIAIGSVSLLWKDNLKNGTLPNEEDIREAMLHTDIDMITIDSVNMTVYFSDPKIKIDAGAIAKGFATEIIGEKFSNRGFNILISAGGNIKANGEKDSNLPWSIGIQNPYNDKNDTFLDILEEKNISVVTSGNALRFYEINGKKYGHIIDIDTMSPCEKYASVTVKGPDSGICDALSTALFCMEQDEGEKLIESLKDYGALWANNDKTIKKSKNF